MDRVTLLQQIQDFQGNIDIFNKMVRFKTEMQLGVRYIMDAEDNRKLKADIRNESLITKMVVIADQYHQHNRLDTSKEIMFALTKSAAVILSELDLPEFASMEGHLRLYQEFLAYSESDEAYKSLLLLTLQTIAEHGC